MVSAAPNFRSPGFGREWLEPGLSIPRHGHEHGYIAVILSGGYQEAGSGGRVDLKAGDVVVHRAFDAHLDHVCGKGAQVLNLPLPDRQALPEFFTIQDPDAIARAAERDPLAAALELAPSGQIVAANDWPDRLASDIASSPDHPLSSWAENNNLAPETLSRGFRKAYGTSPARFRLEIRTYRALRQISETDNSLAAIASDCGFADQPHLTRAIVRLTGRSPGSWRRGSIPFKTGPNLAR